MTLNPINKFEASNYIGNSFKKNVQKGLIMNEPAKCGCGRSPTGNCIGWHALSESDYQKKLEAYKAKNSNKNENK